MSEMLGNQFFMARNYPAAQKELEEVCLKEPNNIPAKKKLLLCYTQTGKLKEAISLFYELISDNIEYLIQTDPIKDDCPCVELIEKIEKYYHPDNFSPEHILILGIIWLYCDEKKSLEYFYKLSEVEPSNKVVSSAINYIEDYILKKYS